MLPQTLVVVADAVQLEAAEDVLRVDLVRVGGRPEGVDVVEEGTEAVGAENVQGARVVQALQVVLEKGSGIWTRALPSSRDKPA